MGLFPNRSERTRVAEAPGGYARRTRDLLGLALRVSRVRFWLYLGGTYAVGYALGARSLAAFADPSVAIFLLFFLVPANVLLYGVNDLFDRDTDRFNEKKGTKEHRLLAGEQRDLRRVVAASGLLGVVLLAALPTWPERLLLGAFLFLAVAYSAPPLRFKARPIVDFGSNVLYGLPGILAFHQASGDWLSAPAILAIALWTSAMHLFSAVPDIEADRRAGLRTTAAVLGRRRALLLTVGLWLGFAVLVAFVIRAFLPWGFAAFLYPALALAALRGTGPGLERIYWLFPYVNAAAGFGLFLLAAMPDLLGALP